MLHRPKNDFERVAPSEEHDVEDGPMLDAGAYIDAMRAIGAKLHPVRGTPGVDDPDGTFSIEPPPGVAARRRIAALDKAFAASRAADPLAEGRVAEALLMAGAIARFAAVVGQDFAIALRAMTQAREDLRSQHGAVRTAEENGACDDALRAAELARAIAVEYDQAAFDHVMAMPVRRKKDFGPSAARPRWPAPCPTILCSAGNAAASGVIFLSDTVAKNPSRAPNPPSSSGHWAAPCFFWRPSRVTSNQKSLRIEPVLVKSRRRTPADV